MIKSYDINDYLKDDKELQKAVIRELFEEISTQQGIIDAYKMSENEANEIIAELQAYKDINEDFKTAWAEFKAKNERLKNCLQEIKRVAETCNSKINCEECPFTDECNTEMEALGVCKIILKLITKAEEE